MSLGDARIGYLDQRSRTLSVAAHDRVGAPESERLHRQGRIELSILLAVRTGPDLCQSGLPIVPPALWMK